MQRSLRLARKLPRGARTRLYWKAAARVLPRLLRPEGRRSRLSPSQRSVRRGRELPREQFATLPESEWREAQQAHFAFARCCRVKFVEKGARSPAHWLPPKTRTMPR